MVSAESGSTSAITNWTDKCDWTNVPRGLSEYIVFVDHSFFYTLYLKATIYITGLKYEHVWAITC